MYRPLPENITIRDSGIHGLGLFATADIGYGTMIGKIHFPSDNPNEPHRTPIGAFGNHSDEPNCSKMYFDDDGSWWVFANRDIKEGEEITWKYTLYEV